MAPYNNIKFPDSDYQMNYDYDSLSETLIQNSDEEPCTDKIINSDNYGLIEDSLNAIKGYSTDLPFKNDESFTDFVDTVEESTIKLVTDNINYDSDGSSYHEYIFRESEHHGFLNGENIPYIILASVLALLILIVIAVLIIYHIKYKPKNTLDINITGTSFSTPSNKSDAETTDTQTKSKTTN